MRNVVTKKFDTIVTNPPRVDANTKITFVTSIGRVDCCCRYCVDSEEYPMPRTAAGMPMGSAKEGRRVPYTRFAGLRSAAAASACSAAQGRNTINVSNIASS
jgi:hypothetical protein